MRRGRRPVAPLFTGPIPDNPEYRAMVNRILEDKRRREVVADILNDKRKRNGAVLVLQGNDGRETHRESSCVAMSE